MKNLSDRPTTFFHRKREAGPCLIVERRYELGMRRLYSKSKKDQLDSKQYK